MDTRDGRIYTPEEMEKFQQMYGDSLRNNSPLRHLIKMETPPTEKQLSRKPPKVGRNEPCPCGSGKKFKQCCLIKDWQERYGK